MADPASADLSRLHVVVPVRGLTDGKARLGMALDAEERETLIVGMLASTLDVLADWQHAAAIHVVSADRRVLALARERGARPVRDGASGELNRALAVARDVALADGATALLCLPADLPLLSPGALDQLHDAADAALAAGRGRPLVVAAPADARDGTNALLVSPPTVIEPAFGESSLAAHVAAAARADATVQLVVDPELGFDLDTTDDLERIDAGRLLELIAIGSRALAAIDRLAEVEDPAAWEGMAVGASAAEPVRTAERR